MARLEREPELARLLGCDQVVNVLGRPIIVLLLALLVGACTGGTMFAPALAPAPRSTVVSATITVAADNPDRADAAYIEAGETVSVTATGTRRE